MVAPGNPFPTTVQHCANVPVQGRRSEGNLSLAAGKKVDGYDVRSQNWSGLGAKLGMTAPDSYSGSTFKPVQDTSGHRIRLHQSADLIGRTTTEEQSGRWNTAKHLRASTYKGSPRLSSRIVTNEVGGGCPTEGRRSPAHSRKNPTEGQRSSPGTSSQVSPRPVTRVALNAASDKQAQKAVRNPVESASNVTRVALNGTGDKQAQKDVCNLGEKASNVDDAASVKCGRPSHCQSPRRSPRAVDETASFKGGCPSSRRSPHRSPRSPSKKSTASLASPNDSTKRMVRCETDSSGLSSQACGVSTANKANDNDRHRSVPPTRDPQSVQAPKARLPLRLPQQDVVKIASCAGVPDEGSYPASAMVRGGSPSSTVPRIVGISGLSNLSKPASDPTSAGSPDMVSIRSTEALSARNHFSYQSCVARTQAQRSKQAIAPITNSPDATYPELPSARNHCSFLQRVLGKGRILHEGGGRLTQEPRGPRYSCDEPEYPILDEDCKESKDTETTASSCDSPESPILDVDFTESRDTETTASSCQDPEEPVELANLDESGQDDISDSVAGGISDYVESYEAPLPSASHYQRLDGNYQDSEEHANLGKSGQIVARENCIADSLIFAANDGSLQECNGPREAPLHSASFWLSFVKRPDEDEYCISADLPESPRSFQCAAGRDDQIVWDHDGFPVTPTHLWLN